LQDSSKGTVIDEISARYDGWRIVAVCFLVATFGWGFDRDRPAQPAAGVDDLVCQSGRGAIDHHQFAQRRGADRVARGSDFRSAI
jgi:hypothetical protein